MTELLLDIEKELLDDWNERLEAANLEFNRCSEATKQLKQTMDAYVDAGETAKAETACRKLIAETDNAYKILKHLLETRPLLVALHEMDDTELLEFHNNWCATHGLPTDPLADITDIRKMHIVAVSHLMKKRMSIC